MFSKRAISIAAPRIWNDLAPKLCNFSLPLPSSLPITNLHIHPAPLSINPEAIYSKLK